MLAKMLSKEWLWIALGTAALLMFAAGTAAAQSNVPVQFAVQTTAGSADTPVRTAIYSAADQAKVSVQSVRWWGRPYRAYYYGARIAPIIPLRTTRTTPLRTQPITQIRTRLTTPQRRMSATMARPTDTITIRAATSARRTTTTAGSAKS